MDKEGVKYIIICILIDYYFKFIRMNFLFYSDVAIISFEWVGGFIRIKRFVHPKEFSALNGCLFKL